LKLSLHATTIVGTIFAAVCFSVAITGFVSMGDIQDATQLSDAKGFAWFWAFLGAVALAFAGLAQWLARTGKAEE
jgi:hypothetical protein